jgi:hypothetical protein
VILLQAAPWSFSDQGFLTFCVILLAIFGVEFRMIQQNREEFITFKAGVMAELKLMNARQSRASQVGVVNALEILSEPNPWTREEMAIRERMYRNPDFEGIEDDEIETVIKRLDTEIAEGNLAGDKLMAAHYMLRELNGELAKRAEERELPKPRLIGQARRWPWSRAS